MLIYYRHKTNSYKANQQYRHYKESTYFPRVSFIIKYIEKYFTRVTHLMRNLYRYITGTKAKSILFLSTKL